MNKGISTEEALRRLQQLCSKSEKCEKDLLDKLKKWKYEDDPVYIIGVLKENNFLNEERFVSAFINDKIRYSKWGKQKISYELKMRGFDESLIKDKLSEFSNEAYLGLIQSELLKKNRSIKEDNNYNREKKLLSFGYQRGFEIDLMKSIIKDILSIN